MSILDDWQACLLAFFGVRAAQNRLELVKNGTSRGMWSSGFNYVLRPLLSAVAEASFESTGTNQILTGHMENRDLN